jgi:hypothetical protein
MKYKPCCERICMVSGCETQEQGGCYCVCRLLDYLNNFKLTLDGYQIYRNKCIIYYPDKVMAQEAYKNLIDNQKIDHDEYVKKIPERIRQLENKIKSYEIE